MSETEEEIDIEELIRQIPVSKKVHYGRKHRNRRRRKRYDSIVHRAFITDGSDDRTSQLTDDEFHSQIWQEAGHYLERSGHHFANAVGGICKLLYAAFSD